MWRFIEGDAAIRSGIQRGLLNTRSVARLIQKRLEEGRKEEASIAAIVSAIRRYPIKERKTAYRQIGKLLHKITMRNEIVDVDIINSPEIPRALGKIAAQIDYSRGEAFRVLAGVESIKVIVDEKNFDKMNVIPKQNIRSVAKDLAEIIISMPQIAGRTPGIVAAVTTELMMYNINLVEFMSCVPEIIIIIDENDATKSYQLIENLVKGNYM